MQHPQGPSVGPEFDPDFEAPSDEDIARFGGDAIACPSCGAEVYHDAAMCQDCGHLLTDADAPRSAPARWVIVGVVGLMITALLLFTFGTPW